MTTSKIASVMSCDHELNLAELDQISNQKYVYKNIFLAHPMVACNIIQALMVVSPLSIGVAISICATKIIESASDKKKVSIF